MKAIEIRVRLDRSQAASATREHNADAKKMLDAMKASFAGQKQAIIDSWKSIGEASKANLKALEQDEKETRRRIAADAVQRGRDSSRAIAEAQREAARATADLEALEGKRALTDETVRIQARHSLIADDNRRRIDGTKNVMEEFRKAATKQAEGNSLVMGGLKGVGNAVVGLVSTYATLGTAVSVIATIAGMWRDQRKDIEASADALHRQREDALAIAALKGNQGQSTTETAEQLKFRAQTLQTAPAALAFQEGVLNTGNASSAAGFISPDELQKLMLKGGQYQATNPKYTPDSVGNLMGILPTMIKTQGQSGDDVFRRAVGIAKTFELGSANPGPAMSQFMKNGMLIGPGMFSGPEELAAVESAFTSVAPDESATLTRQFVRGTTGGLTKMRGSPFEGSIAQSEYLHDELHATEQMLPVQIGRLIAADLKVQEEKARAKGEILNPDIYLTTKGVQEQDTRLANIKFAELINSGAYDKTFGKRATPDSAPTMNEAMAPINQFQNVDPVANARRSELAKNIADVTKSIGPEEYYLQLKRQAFERLRGSGMTYGTFEASNNNPLFQGYIVDEVKRDMENRAKAAGVEIPRPGDTTLDSIQRNAETGYSGLMRLFYPEGARAALDATFGAGTGPLGGSPASRLLTSERTRAQSFFDLNNQILAKGAPAASTDEQVALLKRLVAIQEAAEARARNAVPPAVAIPPVRMPGPGARGVPVR